MRVKRKRRSSSISDDDRPLVSMIRHDDHTSYHNLCRRNKQLCEFCDEVFQNSYHRIVHNMKHIIIPLLNLKVYQCKECLHHFTSQEDLLDHTRKKHKIKLPYTDLVNEKALIKKVPGPVFIDLTTPQEDFDPQVPLESDLVAHSQEDSIENSSIKSRLLFEDDLVLNCDRLLNNFTINCQVNLEACPLNSLEDVNKSVECTLNGFGQSVHYDELVKPGVFRCKKCGKGFPVRYDAIIHEASHLRFKNARVTLCGTCNEYIVGDGKILMLHYLTKHKERPRENIQKLPENNLKIHENNNIKTLSSNTEEISKKLIFEEDEVISYEKMLMLCDLCFSFCKNNNSRSYMCVGLVNELGKRYPCKKCGSLFFEVKLVKQMIHLRRHGDTKKGKKKMSNEERLKSIKHRFKLLKN